MARIKGLGNVRQKLKNLRKKADAAVDKGILKTAHAIKDDARANAPQDQMELVRSIDVEHNPGGTTFVFADAPHAPYQEFGTGGFAVAPSPEYSDYMHEFFVSGKGTTPRTPFLFPAFFKHRESLVTNVEEELKKTLK